MKCLEVVGPQLVAHIETGKGLLETRRLMQEDREPVRRIEVTRSKLQRLLKALYRLGTASELAKCQSEVSPQIRIIGLELDRFLERLESVSAAPQLQQRGPQCRQVQRLRLPPDRTRQPLQRVIELPGVDAQQTHQVQGVGMIAVEREGLLAAK